MGTKRKNNKKVVVVLGPTASGKSDLAVSLALSFEGEVVSADSRQVYRGMDIGSGKITRKEMRNVKHHLLDVANPKEVFTASQYQLLGEKALKNIMEREKLPIICGGTAFYINVILNEVNIPEVPPDWDFRKSLEKQTTEELYEKLKKVDPQRAENIDKKNKRRLIRAVEIVEKTKKPVPNKINRKSPYSPLFLGIKTSQEKLEEKIDRRLKERINKGMIEEIRDLQKDGVSWKRLESFGLEYKWIALYLQGKEDYETAISRLSTEIKQFSKKQMVWWKHDKRIKWIESVEEAEKITKSFLKATEASF
jgi:tRNA dimethylallyltransferase